MKEKSQKEFKELIQEILLEIRNILLNEDVHPSLVESIIKDSGVYLEQKKNQIYSDNNIIKNLLKDVLSTYLIEDLNFKFKKNIVLIGDNGNGKTTVASKMAVILSQKHSVNVVHKDPFRYGSYQQLVENLTGTTVNISQEILSNYDYNIIDTAGFSS
jgi:signal recognition particle GTPase